MYFTQFLCVYMYTVYIIYTHSHIFTACMYKYIIENIRVYIIYHWKHVFYMAFTTAEFHDYSSHPLGQVTFTAKILSFYYKIYKAQISKLKKPTIGFRKNET